MQNEMFSIKEILLSENFKKELPKEMDFLIRQSIRETERKDSEQIRRNQEENKKKNVA